MIVNHFKRQKYKKKIRRKNKRIENAQLRDNDKNFVEETSPLINEINIEELNWIERERQAQEEWKRKQLKLAKPIEEIKPNQDLIFNDKVIKTVSEPPPPPRLKLPFDLPYHNPFEPEFVDQSKTEICHFFRKTGVCRFDLRCSRLHETPVVSDTIVFINMFTSNTMEMMMAGGDPDLSLEYDENELISEYEEFYVDIEKEFLSFGRIVTIRTCRNAMRHLRGNVYVQYRNINDAVYSFSQLNGRFYGGNRLSARFVTIDSWRESICGLYFRGKCPKGGICNFMHVLLNKGESFRDLQHFLNRSNTTTTTTGPSTTRRSKRQRKRSRTCSSIDGTTSTPEPQEPMSDNRRTTSRSYHRSREYLHSTARNYYDKSRNNNRDDRNRDKDRSRTRRNRSRSSCRRKKDKSDRQSPSKRKRTSRHHSRKEKSRRMKNAD